MELFGIIVDTDDSKTPENSQYSSWDLKSHSVSYVKSVGIPWWQYREERAGCAVESYMTHQWFEKEDYKVKVYTDTNGKTHLIPNWVEI